MRPVGTAAVVLTFLLALPGARADSATAAHGGSLGATQLVELHRAGLTDEAILLLAEAEGFERAILTADALSLREAGLSSSLVSRLIALSAGSGIAVEERDGVTVITGRGAPEEADAEAAAPAPGDDRAAPPPAAQAIVVIQQAPPAAGAASGGAVSGDNGHAASDFANGYPAGATFGWSGGAVFLPARFGGSEPSAFGRTVIGFTGPQACAPLLAPAPVILSAEPRASHDLRSHEPRPPLAAELSGFTSGGARPRWPAASAQCATMLPRCAGCLVRPAAAPT